MHEKEDIPRFITRFMPDADEEKQREALENVRAYLRAIARLHARLLRERQNNICQNPESKAESSCS